MAFPQGVARKALAAVAFTLICVIIGPLTIALPLALLITGMGSPSVTGGIVFYAYLFGGPVALAFSLACWPGLLRRRAVTWRGIGLAAVASAAVLPLWALWLGGRAGSALPMATDELWNWVLFSGGLGVLINVPAGLICARIALLLGVTSGQPTTSGRDDERLGDQANR
jgi:hypothetical protein